MQKKYLALICQHFYPEMLQQAQRDPLPKRQIGQRAKGIDLTVSNCGSEGGEEANRLPRWLNDLVSSPTQILH